MATRILAHLDDVGSSHGSVVAWKGLRAAGVVRSASVMVPCPWYRAAVADWHDAPDQDLGVHITLTSEWSTYRWRPLTGPVPGLTDDDGYFHAHPRQVAQNADPEAVADEMAAQIERALADGIRPTHLDAHMGTAYLPQFLGKLLDASERYGIPAMMCRDFAALVADVGLDIGDGGYLAEAEAEVARRGQPIFDRFLMLFCPDEQDAESHYRDLVGKAGEGLHWLALHANAPDDMEAFAPHTVLARRKEYELFADPASVALFAAADAVTCDWRDLAGTSAG